MIDFTRVRRGHNGQIDVSSLEGLKADRPAAEDWRPDRRRALAVLLTLAIGAALAAVVFWSR